MSTDTPNKPEFKPSEDGVTHVNVYSRGVTALGRNLSNHADCNIEHPYFGHFRTLEGLWYYMKTGFCDDSFRIVKGNAARTLGKKMPTAMYPLFNKMFKLGMLEKLDRNLLLQKQLIENELPLTHYYVFGEHIQVLTAHQWQLDHWLLLRSALINTGSLDMIRKELTEEIEFHLKSPDGLVAKAAKKKSSDK